MHLMRALTIAIVAIAPTLAVAGPSLHLGPGAQLVEHDGHRPPPPPDHDGHRPPPPPNHDGHRPPPPPPR